MQLSIIAFAADEDAAGDDIAIHGLEVEKLLNIGSGILATVLFAITLAAYTRTERKRLLYVSLAFALFAIKGFITGAELFFGDWPWVDPFSSVLNFGILLAFFAGVLRK